MTKDKNDLTDLCQEVCDEFKNLGFIKDIDPRTLKESYNISKQQNGCWWKNTKCGLHTPLTKKPLDFSEMPILKRLTDLLDELDLEFKKKGGRIFITESFVYKIKRGAEYSILLSNTPIDKTKNFRYDDLCKEILEHGHERDRYRSDETYIMSKASNGTWSMMSTHENHSGKEKIFNLAKMPHLKMLADKINKIDAAFKAHGGRIFITRSRIYRIKNKIEIDFK